MIRMHLLPAAVAAAVLALGTGPGPVKARFCPQDERFCGSWFPADAQGVCANCARLTAEVEACEREWFWCDEHREWHDRLCPQDALLRCCERRVSYAVRVASDATSPVESLYCPECRQRLEETDLLPDGTCASCQRMPVVGEFVTRTWSWCTRHETWHAERCAEACCTPKEARVLVCRCGPPERICAWRGEAPWLWSHLGDPDLVVVHVGYPVDSEFAPIRDSYREGHVPGARLLPWSAIALPRRGLSDEFPPLAWMTATVRRLGIDTDSRIVLYDTAWGIEAARAYVMFDYLGLGDRTSILDGQWATWVAEGYAVETGPPPRAERSFFVPRPRGDVLVTRDEMRDLAWLARQRPTSVSIIDARTEEAFAAGPIAGSENVPCLMNLRVPFSPAFRDEDALREMYESAGARPGHAIVAYCRTGREAALAYVAARRLGYAARFYDGSYEEWSRSPAPMPAARSTNARSVRR
jgi:thiosulfate/3-mercaptopyruvate sulfurtransferase